jgi:hypothetical protein
MKKPGTEVEMLLAVGYEAEWPVAMLRCCCGAVVLCRGISLLADSDPEMAPRAQEDAELTPSSALHPKGTSYVGR